MTIAGVLLLVAAIVAAYLGWASLSGGLAIGCGPESGCDKVLQSRFAYWLGIPVSLLAIPVYIATGVCAFRLRKSPDCRMGWTIATAGSLLVIGAAIWFAGLQVLAVRAFCRFCMAAHLSGAAGAALLLWTRTRAKDNVRISWATASAVVIVALGTLVAGQYLHQPKTFAVSNIAGAQGGTPKPTAGVPQATPQRILSIYGGQFQLNAAELPVVGSPAAPHLIVSLFDYTCHHCRTMHAVLLQVQRNFSNALGIISLPMPLDPACNAIVKQTHPDHVNACAYARLSLAVWRARPSAHATFDHWLFAPERPPAVEEAHRYASELVGVVALQTAMSDPWVNEQIQRDIAVYDAAYRAGQGSMPQLIIGNKVAVGTMPLENIYQLLDDELNLKTPAAAKTGGAAH